MTAEEAIAILNGAEAMVLNRNPDKFVEAVNRAILALDRDRQAARKDQKPTITVETNIYDKEETYPNCTVQVLTNTATGKTSVGWWMNGDGEDGKGSG